MLGAGLILTGLAAFEFGVIFNRLINPVQAEQERD